MKNTQSHKTIIISAYRNVSIRYLLYGEILDQLIESGLRVVVLVNEENLDYYINKFKDKKIIIEPIFYFKNLRTLRSRLGSVLNTYRLCTSPQGKKINKNTTVDIFKKIYKKEWSENIKGYGVFLLILLVSNVASKSLLIRNLMIKLESLIFKGKQYDNLFKKYDPELLIVSSVGHMLDLYIMNSSKRNNTKIMTIFHNWDGPTTKGYRANEIDYAVVWNQTMKKEVEIYQDISRDRIFVGGCSNYDIFFNQNTYFNTKKTFFDYFQLDSNKKTILYAPGGHNYFPNSLDTLEVILESITNNYYSSEVQVLLRGHPNSIGKEDVKKKIDLLLEKYGEHLKVSMPISKKLNFDVDLSMEDIKILSDILSYSDLIMYLKLQIHFFHEILR